MIIVGYCLSIILYVHVCIVVDTDVVTAPTCPRQPGEPWRRKVVNWRLDRMRLECCSFQLTRYCTCVCIVYTWVHTNDGMSIVRMYISLLTLLDLIWAIYFLKNAPPNNVNLSNSMDLVENLHLCILYYYRKTINTSYIHGMVYYYYKFKV